jgi:hypothetical protein
VIHALLQALQQQNITAYREAYQQLQSLLSLSADYQQRLNLLNKLHQGAQQWAQALRLRQAPHHTPLAADKDICKHGNGDNYTTNYSIANNSI